MMGLDVDVRPRPGMRLYASYVVDDLKKLKIFSDDFANKSSLQSGFFFADPLGLVDTDLRGEYVRIEPWIFTHKIPIKTAATKIALPNAQYTPNEPSPEPMPILGSIGAGFERNEAARNASATDNPHPTSPIARSKYAVTATCVRG